MKFSYNTNLTLPKQSKDLDRSYKMDLDLWDCFGRKKTPSYNQRNMVVSLSPISVLVTARTLCTT